MKNIKLKSRAKINLSIDVLGKREDGYHLVQMIMQTIDLYDVINIEKIDDDKIVIDSNSKDIPLNENNIVYKAIKLIKEEFSISKGVKIFIEKNIPVAAGMAGGSTNAAAVLVGLNKIFGLELTQSKLEELGLRLGADVPFCIKGGASLSEGIGEILTDIDGLDEDMNILVCKPEIFVSTKEIYEGLKDINIEYRPNNEYLIQCLKNGDTKSLCENMVNVLECVTSSKYKDINRIKNIIKEYNPLGCMMSGSGPTVFAIFEDENKAQDAKDKLLEEYKQVYIVKSKNRGVEIIE